MPSPFIKAIEFGHLEEEDAKQGLGDLSTILEDIENSLRETEVCSQECFNSRTKFRKILEMTLSLEAI